MIGGLTVYEWWIIENVVMSEKRYVLEAKLDTHVPRNAQTHVNILV